MQYPVIFTPDKINIKSNQAGYTLIEMMVAITILAVALLGLGGLVTTSIQNNLKNDLRGIASRMAGETAEALRTQPFDSVATGDLNTYDGTNTALAPNFRIFPNPVQQIRSGNQTFTVNWTVQERSDDLLEIWIQVQYTLKGEDYTNNTTIYRARES